MVTPAIPEERVVYATSDLLLASLFAFRNRHTRAINTTCELAPLMIYDGTLPNPADEGYVYEIGGVVPVHLLRPDGQDTIWTVPESAMSPVYDPITRGEVPGIRVYEPHERLKFERLVAQKAVSLYRLTDMASETFLAKARVAARLGRRDDFFRSGLHKGWLRNITHEVVGQ